MGRKVEVGLVGVLAGQFHPLAGGRASGEVDCLPNMDGPEILEGGLKPWIRRRWKALGGCGPERCGSDPICAWFLCLSCAWRAAVDDRVIVILTLVVWFPALVAALVAALPAVGAACDVCWVGCCQPRRCCRIARSSRLYPPHQRTATKRARVTPRGWCPAGRASCRRARLAPYQGAGLDHEAVRPWGPVDPILRVPELETMVATMATISGPATMVSTVPTIVMTTQTVECCCPT